MSISDCHIAYTYRFVAGYEDGNPKSPLICLGSGSDGVGVLSNILTNDIIAYALCRVVSTRPPLLATLALISSAICSEVLKDMVVDFRNRLKSTG